MQHTIDSVWCIPVHCVARFLRYVFLSRKKVITFCNRCDLRYLVLISLQPWFTPDPKVSLYPDVVLFFFSFFQKTSASAQARWAREREKEFFFPTPTPLRWRSINPPRFNFYHACLTDFEEKIEGLWTGYPKVQCLAFHSMNSVLRLCFGIHHALGRNDLNDRSRKSMRIDWKNCLPHDACFDK